jgi:hypothetical protein
MEIPVVIIPNPTPVTNLFIYIKQMLTSAGTDQVPLAQSTTVLVSHRPKSIDSDDLLSCATSAR